MQEKKPQTPKKYRKQNYLKLYRFELIDNIEQDRQKLFFYQFSTKTCDIIVQTVNILFLESK